MSQIAANLEENCDELDMELSSQYENEVFLCIRNMSLWVCDLTVLLSECEALSLKAYKYPETYTSYTVSV